MKFNIALVIFFFFFGVADLKSKEHPPQAKGGVIDLRNFSFKEPLSLNGEWEFFWNKLFIPSTSDKGELIPFPKRWNDFSVFGNKYPAFGFATYRLKVLLPTGGERLRIDMPDVYCAYNLYLNGELLLRNGTVATTAEGFKPYWENKGFDIPPHLDTAVFVLQISNFAHSKGGVKEPIALGKSDELQLMRNRSEAIDLLLTGCLFMGGLFFLGLYLMGNRDKAVLLFALYSIVYCYRIIGVNNYVIHSLFPQASWKLMVHLEYLSLFTSIGIFGLYTRYLYPKDVNKWIVKGIFGICMLFSLATIVLPPYYFTQLIDPFLVVTVFCIAYALYIYTLVFIRKRPGSRYALLSSISLMLTFLIALLNYWALLPELQLISFWGYVSFFFFQSLILSHRVSYQLKQANTLAKQGLTAKSEFLSTMSHEIRTPLNSVIGMGHLLLENNPRQDQVEHLDIMLFSANNLLGIVNDILDFSKIEAGKIELDEIEIDIASITKNIIAGLQSNAEAKNIELNMEIDPLIKGKVLGDPTRLFQVLTNLVHNAIKFTKVGKVLVCVKVVQQDAEYIEIKFAVEDTGIGISKAKQAIIFDRFTQADSSTSRSFGGTGLGLAISKRILELQGSTLQVRSEENVGSVFYFVQRFKKAEERAVSESVLSKAVDEVKKPFDQLQILLAEDNSINVLVAKGFLQKWGAKVDVAENGMDALEKLDLKRHQLILMDLNMPVMDGYEASAKIRELSKEIPIIALTANILRDVEEKLNEVGINDIIVKPFLPDELYRKIIKLLPKDKP